MFEDTAIENIGLTINASPQEVMERLSHSVREQLKDKSRADLKDWLMSKKPELSEEDAERVHDDLLMEAGNHIPLLQGNPRDKDILRVFYYVKAFGAYDFNVPENNAHIHEREEFIKEAVRLGKLKFDPDGKF